MKFWAPGFGLFQLQPWWPFGKSVSGWNFSVSVSRFLFLFLCYSAFPMHEVNLKKNNLPKVIGLAGGRAGLELGSLTGEKSVYSRLLPCSDCCPVFPRTHDQERAKLNLNMGEVVSLIQLKSSLLSYFLAQD